MSYAYPRGKGTLLDKIRDFDPNVSGRYLKLNGDDPDFDAKAKDFMQQNPNRDYILRSDATCEDFTDGDRIVTFAGVFDSINIYNDEKYVESIRRSISDPHDLATGNPSLVEAVLDRLAPDFSKERKELLNIIINSRAEVKAYRKKVAEITKGYEYPDYPEEYWKLERDNEYLGVGGDYALSDLKELSGKKDNYALLREETRRLLETGGDFSEIVHRFKDRGFELMPMDEYGNSDSRKATEISKYTDLRGVNMRDSQMNFILHENYDRGSHMVFCLHPNLEETLHTEYREKGDHFWWGSNFKLTMNDKIKDLPEGSKKVIEAYMELISDLDPNLVYVAESIPEEGKIVQLRPAFKKVFRENHLFTSVIFDSSVIDTGITFTYDPKTDSYPELEIVERTADVLHLRPSKDIRMVMTREMDHDKLLSHAHLRLLEGIQAFNCYGSERLGLDKIWGANTIRYDGDNGFERIA